MNPNKVIRTKRSVIEHKLLTALQDDSVVAILATKQDLETMIAALYGYEIGQLTGRTLSWAQYENRRMELADSLKQLLDEAFEG